MDIDQLRAFLTIAKTGSFSLTAEALYVTQPAVSKRLASLEAELGTPLIDRVGRNLQLTQAGKTLQPKAQAIVLDVERAKKSIVDLAEGVRGELKVATSHHLGLHKLPPVLRRYCAKYPEVNLQFEFLDSEIALDRVAKGLCELAVITLPPKCPDALIVNHLWTDKLTFVTHINSSLPTNTTLKTLSQEPAILPDLNTYTGRLIKSCFDQHHLSLSLNMATNYLETIKMMVSVGLGWSVLPKSMLEDHTLKIIQVEKVQLARELGVVQHSKRHLSNAAQAFNAMLVEAK